MNPQPDWINKTLYPFQSRWMEIDGNQIHYLDEGKGPVLLFVHGTPEWSFAYRDLIIALRPHFRCVAIDHLGFGLSEKPQLADYRCQAHAVRLEKFIAALDLKDLSLVANDFGGGIGMSYAIHHPGNIRRIVLFNTWMWSVREDKHYAGPSRVIKTWFGRWMYLSLNFPVRVIMPAAYGDRKKLTPEAYRHYKMPLASPEERVGTYAFARELMDASPWWQALWEQVAVLRDKPVLLFWGMKDKFVQPYELEKWKSAFPQATVVTFTDTGHFVQEEKAAEMGIEIRKFVS